MRIAVTGAAGFVGGHLVDRFLTDGHDVTALDTLESRYGNASDTRLVNWVQGDVRDRDFVSSWIDTRIDMVFHMAAVVGVSNYMASPLDVIDVNVIGTRNVLDAAAKHGLRTIVASTSEVFGKNPSVPWAEDADRILGATNVDRWSYSTSKAVSEHLAFALHRQHDLPVTVVRYFNAYGPRQAPNYVISRSIHRILNGKKPVVYDGGRQTRCFTYVSDLVGGTIASASEVGVGQDFNLGSNTETSVADVTRMVLEETGSDEGWEDIDTAEMYGGAYEDIARRVPDTAKADERLGWRAETELREGIRSTIEWARSHPDWLMASEPKSVSAPATRVKDV